MKFYEKNWFIILMIILFFPVGLFLMWKYKKFNKAARIIISGFCAIMAVVSIVSPPVQEDSTVATNVDKENKQQETPKIKQEEVVKEPKVKEETKDTKNLGVSVKSVEKEFKGQGFTFENSPLQDGTPRLLGNSPKEKGSAILELQGKDKLTSATLIVGASKDVGNNALNILYSALLVRQVCPNYKEFTDWFGEGLKQFVNEPNKKLEKVIDNKKITISFLKELGTIQVQIKPN